MTVRKSRLRSKRSPEGKPGIKSQRSTGRQGKKRLREKQKNSETERERGERKCGEEKTVKSRLHGLERGNKLSDDGDEGYADEGNVILFALDTLQCYFSAAKPDPGYLHKFYTLTTIIQGHQATQLASLSTPKEKKKKR